MAWMSSQLNFRGISDYETAKKFIEERKQSNTYAPGKSAIDRGYCTVSEIGEDIYVSSNVWNPSEVLLALHPDHSITLLPQIPIELLEAQFQHGTSKESLAFYETRRQSIMYKNFNGLTSAPYRSRAIVLHFSKLIDLRRVKGWIYITPKSSEKSSSKLIRCGKCRGSGLVDVECSEVELCFNDSYKSSVPKDDPLHCDRHGLIEIPPHVNVTINMTKKDKEHTARYNYEHRIHSHSKCQHDLPYQHKIYRGKDCVSCSGTGKRDIGGKYTPIELTQGDYSLKLFDARVVKNPARNDGRKVKVSAKLQIALRRYFNTTP